MASAPVLSLAFIDRRPAAAARALTAMDIDDAAAFVEDIPVRYVARVLARLSTWTAAGIVSRVSPAAASAALKSMHYQRAAAVLRLMEPACRRPVLLEMPTRLQRDFHTSLAFPADTVGAFMTTMVLTQPGDHTVADARDQIRRARRVEDAGVVVVDDAHRLLGVVPLLSLLRERGGVPLRDLMDTELTPLSARARLSSVVALEAWDQFSGIPVVSRGKHVIGILGRKTLREAVAMAATGVAAAGNAPPLALVATLGDVIGGLVGLLVPTKTRGRADAP